MAEIGVAHITVNMLKSLWAAHQSGGAAAAAAQLTNIAAQLGTSTQAVWNGVIAAQGAANAAIAGWAGTVAELLTAKELGLSAKVVAAGAPTAPTVAGGIAAWWAGVAAGVKVVLVAGVAVVVIAGVGWAAGWWPADSETATPVAVAAEDGTDSAEAEDGASAVDGEAVEYAGTVRPGTPWIACPKQARVDGSFELTTVDGRLHSADLDFGGEIPVGFVGEAESEARCAADEIVCRAEFLIVVRHRDDATDIENQAGRVYGPGYENEGCDRDTYFDPTETAEATIELDELTERRVRGRVVSEGVDLLEFSGRRRG